MQISLRKFMQHTIIPFDLLSPQQSKALKLVHYSFATKHTQHHPYIKHNNTMLFNEPKRNILKLILKEAAK